MNYEKNVFALCVSCTLKPVEYAVKNAFCSKSTLKFCHGHLTRIILCVWDARTWVDFSAKIHLKSIQIHQTDRGRRVRLGLMNFLFTFEFWSKLMRLFWWNNSNTRIAILIFMDSHWISQNRLPEIDSTSWECLGHYHWILDKIKYYIWIRRNHPFSCNIILN